MDAYEYAELKLGYFVPEFGALPYADTLHGMPLSSACGSDCRDLIDKAGDLLVSFHDFGEHQEDVYGTVVESVVFQCSVFVRG